MTRRYGCWCRIAAAKDDIKAEIQNIRIKCHEADGGQ